MPAVPVLPAVASEYVLIAAGLTLLIMISVLGRAVLVWQAITRVRQLMDATAARFAEDGGGRPRVAEGRVRLGDVNARLEAALWSIPTFDNKLLEARARLAGVRQQVTDFDGQDGQGVGRSMGAVVGVLEMLSAGRRLRRVIQR